MYEKGQTFKKIAISLTEPYDNLLIISEHQHLIPQRHCSKFAYVKHLGLVY